MEDVQLKLNQLFLCRNKEINTLCRLLGSSLLNEEPVAPCIYLYGPPAVGKTVVTVELLKQINVSSALIRCVECYTPQLLFGNLLAAITGCSLDKPCSSFLDFLIALQLVFKNTQKTTFVIIMKQCEYLTVEQLSFFGNFPKIVKHMARVCVVFISNSSYCKLNCVGLVPVKIYFPRYNKIELIELLAQHFKSNNADNFFNIFVSSFYPVTRDFLELKQLAGHCLTSDVNSIERNLLYSDQICLFGLMKPLLKDRSELRKFIFKGNTSNNIEGDRKINTPAKYNSHIELPYFTKWLVAAAYLVSSLHPKEDVKNFVKLSSKRKKSKKTSGDINNLKGKETIAGSRNFSVNRLLATFFAITNKSPTISGKFLSQISSLIDLRLLNYAWDSNLNKPQLKYNFDIEQHDIPAMLKLK